MNGEKPLVMIINDDATEAERCAGWLNEAGFGTIIAHSEPHALELAENAEPDVMLIDVIMAVEGEKASLAGRISADPRTQHIPVVLTRGMMRPTDYPVEEEVRRRGLQPRDVVSLTAAPESLVRGVGEALESGKRA